MALDRSCCLIFLLFSQAEEDWVRAKTTGTGFITSSVILFIFLQVLSGSLATPFILRLKHEYVLFSGHKTRHQYNKVTILRPLIKAGYKSAG